MRERWKTAKPITSQRNVFHRSYQEFFRAGEFSRKQGASIKISSTAYERKVPQGKNMGFFLLETLKTTLKMRNLTEDGQNQGIFFQIFQFLKKGRGDLPLLPPSSYALEWSLCKKHLYEGLSKKSCSVDLIDIKSTLLKD